MLQQSLRPTAALLICALVLSSVVFSQATGLAQTDSSTGCLNQWLFNGVWRAKVTKIEPLMNGSQQSGWQVTEVWRNGTSRELAPADSLMKDQQLVLSSQALTAEGHRQNGLAFNTFAPSGEFTYVQTFLGPNNSVNPQDKPKALDVTFDAAKVATMTNKPHFTSQKYNFHYNLDCVASGAAAQAQGGSTQLAATEGCMNQWMSNGVWKMRVLAVSPNPPGATAASQNGWRVKQEWVNITNRKLFPGVLPNAAINAVQSNVSDEFLVTKGGNNASTFNMAGGFAIGAQNKPFPPGGSYTFEQLIGWNPFDASDTPTRLLVTFDVAKQNALSGVPHYRKPANFRISLACGGTVTMAPGQSAPATAQPAAPSQSVATAQTPKTTSPSVGVDPCAMLSAPDVASAMGVGVQSVGPGQRSSANECTWAIAAHAGAPAQNVVLEVQNVQAAKGGCHGFGCLNVVQSVLGPAMPSLPSQFAGAFSDAQMIAGLGDKAAWKDGKLTVVKAETAFQLLVNGTGSPALATSETLARDVLNHIP